MRILKSRRGADGYDYHTCPLSGENIKYPGCAGCLELDHVEILPATYRIHCLFDAADELPQFKPAKAAAKVPPTLGGDPFKLKSHELLEPKLDGVRVFMHIGEAGTSNRLTTRRKNREGLYNEVTDQLPHLRDLPMPAFYAGSVLDGEILMPSSGTSAGSLGSTMSVIGASPEKALEYQRKWGFVQYEVFDMPFACKRDIRSEVLATRRMQLADFWQREEMTILHQNIVQPVVFAYCATEKKKRDFVQQCLALGYEGAVLKDLESHYGQLRGWIKIKEKHTLDLQIVGWEWGKAGGKHADSLGSLCMAARMPDGVLEEVCTVSPGTDAQRNYWFDTLVDLEQPGEIRAEGFIAEVEFQCWTKEYRLRHPRILRYRHDRSAPSVVDFSTIKRS